MRIADAVGRVPERETRRLRRSAAPVGSRLPRNDSGQSEPNTSSGRPSISSELLCIHVTGQPSRRVRANEVFLPRGRGCRTPEAPASSRRARVHQVAQAVAREVLISVHIHVVAAEDREVDGGPRRVRRFEQLQQPVVQVPGHCVPGGDVRVADLQDGQPFGSAGRWAIARSARSTSIAPGRASAERRRARRAVWSGGRGMSRASGPLSIVI